MCSILMNYLVEFPILILTILSAIPCNAAFSAFRAFLQISHGSVAIPT